MKKQNTKNKIKQYLLIIPVILMGMNAALGQLVLDEEPKRLYYEFTTKRIRKLKDMKNFRDVFHKDKFLMGKNRIMGNISYNTGRVLISDGVNARSENRNALGFFTRIRFFEEFSINTTFYKDFNKRAAARWIADYTYSIGRYNWRASKFNYGYENYINNKYTDSFKTFSQKFLEGYYYLSYNYVPKKLNRNIKIDSTTSVRLTFLSRYAIKYRGPDEISRGGISDGKSTLGASCRFTIIWNIYIESAVYFYPEPQKKLPWDPDYSYGFGYFDWRNFRLSLTYGNWAINRFPWNKNTYPDYGFWDGNFRLVANWIW